MMTKTIRTLATLITGSALTLASPSLGFCQSQLPKAMSMLPADAVFATGLDLTAFSNPKSLLSLVPKDDLIKEFSNQQAAKGPLEAEDTGSAALMVAFTSGNVDKFTAFAISGRNIRPDGSTTDEYCALTGTFTKREGLGILKSFKVKPGPGTTGIFPTKTGGAIVYVSVPSDNVMLFSTQTDWIGTAPTLASTKTGLFSPTSTFTTSVGSYGGRLPDLMFFLDGETIRQRTAGNMMVQTMARPVLGAKGHSFGLFASDVPTLEIHSAFADAAGAEGFKKGVQTMLTAQGSQIDRMKTFAKDPVQKAQFENASKIMKEVKVGTAGNAGTIIYTFNERPTPAEAKEFFAKAIEQFKNEQAADQQAPPPPVQKF